MTLFFPDNANHVLKHEPKLRSQWVVQGYNADNARLDAETTDAIVAWLSARAGLNHRG